MVEHVLAKGAFLGDVFQQILAINLPAEFGAGPLGDGRAAGAGLAADGNRSSPTEKSASLFLCRRESRGGQSPRPASGKAMSSFEDAVVSGMRGSLFRFAGMQELQGYYVLR